MKESVKGTFKRKNRGWSLLRERIAGGHFLEKKIGLGHFEESAFLRETGSLPKGFIVLFLFSIAPWNGLSSRV